jgi:hypothetical protein
MKSVVKAIAVAATALVVIVSNPLASFAGDGGSKKASINEEQVSVKYVGTENNHVVFQVQFQNPTGEKFAMIIKNDNGDVVYQQQFSGTHFAKSVYFENTDGEIEPTFIIRNANNEVVRQFHVVKTITENTTVTSL